MGLEQHIAQATNLLCFIPSALVSVIFNFKRGLINYKNAFVIIIFGILGAVIGSITSDKMPVAILRKFFGVFLIFISLYEIYSYYKLYIKNKNRHNKIKWTRKYVL